MSNDAQNPATPPGRLWIGRLGCLLVGGVFLAAGALKVADPMVFARAIVEYQIAPMTIVPALAVVLPWWEIAAGLMAALGRWRAGALALLTGFSAAFLAVVAITLARGLSPTCACFGVFSERIGAPTALLELALLAACALLLWRELRRAEQ